MVFLQYFSNEVSCYAAMERPETVLLHPSYLLAFAHRGEKPVFMLLCKPLAVGWTWHGDAIWGVGLDFRKNPGKM